MNLLFEIIGYIGSALVIFSMFMTSVKYLRMVNMSGSVMSIIYAIYFGAYPVLLMNVGLLVINAIQLFRIYKYTKRKKSQG